MSRIFRVILIILCSVLLVFFVGCLFVNCGAKAEALPANSQQYIDEPGAVLNTQFAGTSYLRWYLDNGSYIDLDVYGDLGHWELYNYGLLQVDEYGDATYYIPFDGSSRDAMWAPSDTLGLRSLMWYGQAIDGTVTGYSHGGSNPIPYEISYNMRLTWKMYASAFDDTIPEGRGYDWDRVTMCPAVLGGAYTEDFNYYEFSMIGLLRGEVTGQATEQPIVGFYSIEMEFLLENNQSQGDFCIWAQSKYSNITGEQYGYFASQPQYCKILNDVDVERILWTSDTRLTSPLFGEYQEGYNVGKADGILIANQTVNLESASYLAGYEAGLQQGGVGIFSSSKTLFSGIWTILQTPIFGEHFSIATIIEIILVLALVAFILSLIRG